MPAGVLKNDFDAGGVDCDCVLVARAAGDAAGRADATACAIDAFNPGLAAGWVPSAASTGRGIDRASTTASARKAGRHLRSG